MYTVSGLEKAILSIKLVRPVVEEEADEGVGRSKIIIVNLAL